MICILKAHILVSRDNYRWAVAHQKNACDLEPALRLLNEKQFLVHLQKKIHYWIKHWGVGRNYSPKRAVNTLWVWMIYYSALWNWHLGKWLTIHESILFNSPVHDMFLTWWGDFSKLLVAVFHFSPQVAKSWELHWLLSHCCFLCSLTGHVQNWT